MFTKKQSLFCLFIFLCISVAMIFRINRINDLHRKQFNIVTTTSMLADAVRNIVHDNAQVYSLMGPGIDPHLYHARESDVHKLAAANLIVYNGLHLEGKMGQILDGMQRFTVVVNASDALDKIQLRQVDFENLYDPHIWFDVSLWILVVRSLQKQIIALDSAHADFYHKNGDAYIAQLEQLHNYVHNRVNEIDEKKRILITAHDAFGYFGGSYGFTVVGLQGLSTDCDISTRDIQELADYIVEKKVRAIFIESSIPERTLLAVQHAVVAQGWHVNIGAELYSDALGDEDSEASTYIGMVKYNVDAIVDALKV